MRDVLHHVAFALAVLGLAQAATRASSRIVPAGLERALVALVLGVAAAVGEALGLGLIGLGGSAVALSAAAAATWAAALVLLPSPAVPPLNELRAWFRRLDGPLRIGAAALAGSWVAWVAWQLHAPSIGFDSALYHYPDIAGWIANGRPGSQLDLSYDIPYGNYPMTDEVAQTWGAGISRSYIPIALWNPAMLVALAAAGWLILRDLRVSRAAAALGTSALLAAPILVRQLNEPQTDLPAMAWLACTAALSLGARRRPALLVPAMLAAGLGIGSKTTTAPVAVAVLAGAVYVNRTRLRPLSGWLAVGLVGAFAVGGFWYARNLVQHGSPLWPFVAAPWGDPSPRFFALIDKTFLERPGATLDGRLGEYASRLGGGWLVLAGALLALAIGAFTPIRERGARRGLVVSGGLALVSLFIWSLSWGTGMQSSALPGAAGWSISTLRYLLPTIGVAIVAVALATRLQGAVGRAATVLLAASLAWSLVANARIGSPYTPSLGVLLLGASTAVLALELSMLVRRRLLEPNWHGPRVPPVAIAVIAAAAAGALLAPVGEGFIERSTRVSGSTAPAASVVRWVTEQPGYDDGDRTIAIASRAVISSFAGDHFEHRLKLIPARASCRQVNRLAARVPTVVTGPEWFRGIVGHVPYNAPRCLAGRRPAYREGAYAVYWPHELPASREAD